MLTFAMGVIADWHWVKPEDNEFRSKTTAFLWDFLLQL